MNSRTILSQLSMALVLSAAAAGCGGKAPIKNHTPAKSGDQKALVSSTVCVNAQQCPQIRINLSGISSLGASAETLLMWNVGAITPDDKTRQVMVVMETLLPGMEVISKATDPRVSVNWKPLVPETGVMNFRARDVSRCQKVTSGSVNCGDMTVLQPQFEQILPTPYQVVPKNETFNAADSEFFRQFHCETQGMTNEEKAILAGGSVAVRTAGSLDSDSRSGSGYGSQSTSGIRKDVAVITDYLVNGNEEPTAYQCLKQNATAAKQAPVETSVLQK
jgi:hypothetical protein